MWIRTTSDIVRSLLSLFDMGAGPGLARTSFLPTKRPHCIRSVHNLSLESACDGNVHLIGRTNAVCSARRPTHSCPLWCCAQNCSSATPRDIIHRQVRKKNFPDGTLLRPV